MDSIEQSPLPESFVNEEGRRESTAFLLDQILQRGLGIPVFLIRPPEERQLTADDSLRMGLSSEQAPPLLIHAGQILKGNKEGTRHLIILNTGLVLEIGFSHDSLKNLYDLQLNKRTDPIIFSQKVADITQLLNELSYRYNISNLTKDRISDEIIIRRRSDQELNPQLWEKLVSDAMTVELELREQRQKNLDANVRSIEEAIRGRLGLPGAENESPLPPPPST